MFLPTFNSQTDKPESPTSVQGKATSKKNDVLSDGFVSSGTSTLIFVDTKRSRVRLRLSVGFPSPLAPSRRKPAPVAFSGEKTYRR